MTFAFIFGRIKTTNEYDKIGWSEKRDWRVKMLCLGQSSKQQFFKYEQIVNKLLLNCKCE